MQIARNQIVADQVLDFLARLGPLANLKVVHVRSSAARYHVDFDSVLDLPEIDDKIKDPRQTRRGVTLEAGRCQRTYFIGVEYCSAQTLAKFRWVMTPIRAARIW